MAGLWKKESNSADALYIDLFANHRNTRGFQEWDRQVRASNWTHRFLFKSIVPGKNNKISNEFRAEGNMYFKQTMWTEAMELYSQALCFAEPGTDAISLSYANRATCFLHLKKYSQCLKDIGYAIEANYPANRMPKLMQRKNNCEKLKEKNAEEEPFDPKLSFDADEKFPCMANVLEIRQNAEFGRHMVAKCDIGVGETVLVEENYVSITSGHDRVNCFGCTQSMANFIPCPTCTDAMFCSEKCFTQNDIHQKFCGASIHRMPNNVKYIAKSILTAINAYENANEMIDIVEDVVSKRSTQLPTATNNPKSKHALFLSLQPAKSSALDIETVYKVYSGLLDNPIVKGIFDSEDKRRFLMHLIAEHFLIIANNSYGGSLSQASAVGTTALIMSLFNHACAPNVFNSTAENKEVCITMRPIKKGEQLFVKYLCGDRTTRQRQDMLLQQWGFLCKCDKCVPNCPLEDRKKMKSDPCFKAMSSFNSFSTNNYTFLAEKCKMFLEKYGHLPWSEEMDVVLKIYTKCLLDPFPSM